MKIRGFEVVSVEKRKHLEKEITLPRRGTSKAMAYDIFSPVDLVIKPNEIGKIWTDVSAYMQDNEALILNVRSSQGGKVMLANSQGWIDADYTGFNIGVFLKNIGTEDYIIKEGDRIAQAMFVPFLVADNGNTDKERVGGFGSTGV